MIVRYDSYVLKKCMKPAGNFLCVRGVKGMRCRRCDAALGSAAINGRHAWGKRTVCDVGWKWMYGTIENKL